MKPEPDFEYTYPVADCPNCKEELPFGTLSFIKDGMLRTRNYCLNCHQVANIEPKGYLSALELEEGEWDIEL